MIDLHAAKSCSCWNSCGESFLPAMPAATRPPHRHITSQSVLLSPSPDKLSRLGRISLQLAVMFGAVKVSLLCLAVCINASISK